MTDKEIQGIVESRYNRLNWQKLLHGIFGAKVKFFAAPTTLLVEKAIASEAVYLGDITLQDDHKIAIYEVHLSEHVNIERNRAGIRNLLCSQWRGGGFAGAFMLCYRNSESVLRFSYVSESWAFNEDGAYKKESTDALRFTYLLGEGHRSRTAVRQFMELANSGLTLKDVTKAFSVEALSKRFFNEYKEKYEDIVEYVTGERVIKEDGKWVTRTTGLPNKKIMAQFAVFVDPEKAVRDYVKKLMGRLVFIQFLQKKGWMGVPADDAAWINGDKDFVQNLFKKTKNKDSFIDDVLEPLFDDLNTKREDDLVSSEMVGKGIKVPYLNGGLFEKDAQDNTEFPLPKKFMEDLLEFFTQYNFTIDENDPDDAEVGVDPEMLSCIFENLLEDNKEKGAFYTPKEIVQYMCRESLIAHLCNGVKKNETKNRIRDFVLTHKADVLNGDENISEQIDEKLKSVKICDPAIGSGAFPMGLMRELYFCRSAIEGFDHAKAAEIKKHIIQQNIYGVDIEKGAVDIARLRFWLSLIVDEETPHALPNLDFKIMQGNSLLEQYEGIDLSDIAYKASNKEKKNGRWFDLFDSGLTKNKQLISFLKDKFFDCEDHETKRQIRDALKSEIQALLLEKGCDIKLDAIRDVTATDQFFLWHTWFSEVFEQGGFDIVIGNPPYVDSETMTKVMPELRDLYSSKFSAAKGNWDLFVVFVEQGIRICKRNGIYSFIVPNKLIAAKYAEKIRVELKQTSLIEIRDYGRVPVFLNAAVYPCTIVGRKEKESLQKVSFMKMMDLLSCSNNNQIENSFLKEYDFWDIFFIKELEMSVVQKFLIHKTLQKTNEVIGSATVSEAYEIKKVLKDSFEKGNSFKVINTGTIDPYQSLWGVKSMQYIKGKYEYPRILFSDLNKINKKRVEQAQAEKIIVAGMSSRIEAVYDNGETLAGKSTTIILGKNLKYVLGILNSSIVCFSINILYNSMKMAGGYLNIGTRELERIPIPSATKEQQQPIVDLVDKILAAKKANPQADTSDLEKQVDQLVYKLYNLTPTEIKTIEKA